MIFEIFSKQGTEIGNALVQATGFCDIYWYEKVLYDIISVTQVIFQKKFQLNCTRPASEQVVYYVCWQIFTPPVIDCFCTLMLLQSQVNLIQSLEKID